jgi:hypothetical protein
MFMKKTTAKIAACIAAIALFTSCSSTTKFPVSGVTPAADITVTKKKEAGKNYTITLKAENLSSPDRLAQPKKYYVIWMVSETSTVRNAGYFTNKNAKSSMYKASFPYNPVEVFITAEDEDGLCEPLGVEIARAKIR